jgi:N-acyl-D-aspartate/D-glutamate deacylase
MYNEAAPERCLTYYDACAAAQDRGHEVTILANCQPLSFDFTLDEPYVMLSHAAFDAIKGRDHAGRKSVYADPAFRAAFRANLAAPKTGIIFLGNWERIEVSIAALESNKPLEGRTVAALARERGCDPVDLFCDLGLEEDLGTHYLGKFFQNDDAGVAPLLKHRAGVISLSDAGAHLIYMCDAGFGLHFLGHWVRDTGHFTLEEGIRRLTSDPARRFRIPARGRLVEGAPADLLLFDPATVGVSRPRSVADLPGGGSRMVRDPVGLHGVWVNGVKVHDGRAYVAHARGPGEVLDRFDA